jgi:hypothetical protein
VTGVTVIFFRTIIIPDHPKPFAFFANGANRELIMDHHANNVGRCSNGLTARKLRAATPTERVIYRKWLRGVVVFYVSLAIAAGLFAVVNHARPGSESMVATASRSAAAAAKTN